MFIGDGGTLLMGTIMSVFVLGALNNNSLFAACVNADFGIVPFVLSMLAIPVFDTIRVMFVRIIRGASPFRPDKTHLHHLLLDLHFSHIGTTMVEILANFGVVGSWYLSYKLGASIDVQTYVVIGLGLLITFGFYKFARVQERRKTKIYYLMTKIGDLTHVEDKNWFKSLTKFLDRGY
jgi:UDP-N-acetylmuramyl pentapeptide phosphotransferase/UDP-N-acetylglucosamine-1-phosphate transferase